MKYFFQKQMKQTLLYLITFLTVFPVFAEKYDLSRFEREILIKSSRDAIQFEVLANGDIVFVEFAGEVKWWEAKSRTVRDIGRVPTYAKGEVGLLGFAVSPDFLENGHLFTLHCPSVKQDTMRVSRFVVKGKMMDIKGEEVLLEWSYDDEHVFHMGGAVFMDGRGHLYIGNGDNCHWKPGLPIDYRPGKKSWDAMRSAGNSQDLRGKILRIQPEEKGGYTIPKGNLFTDSKQGRLEIYAMGVRNPFRMTVDDADGTLYFGDVGPNVFPELKINPLGYDEINAAPKAGNFGWPLFIGPNEPYPVYDFDNNKVVATFKPSAPENLSPNNTGLKKLPHAQPALIWYGNLKSERFPSLGIGGRSIMAGPVYHYDPKGKSAIRLPKELDGHLFIYEWMRNWIQVSKLGSIGPEVKPFLPDWNFRRPVDMKLGADGALYLIEYGDKWWENSDSRISRIVYRRGNRPPVAAIVSNVTAGKHPLKVMLDGGGSSDPDGDSLKYKWNNGKEGPKQQVVFTKPGTYTLTLTAADSNGAKHTTSQVIHVGNARPKVSFKSPAHGSFFDWKEKLNYEVVVLDKETLNIDENLVSLQGEFRNRRYLTDTDAEFSTPGLALMRKSTCFACHISDAPSAGPSYEIVAKKYSSDPSAPERLALKVLQGGVGAWGQQPMPPHPQHNIEESRLMIDWILSLDKNNASTPRRGLNGVYRAPSKRKNRVDEGVLVLTAGYTDAGAEGVPALRGESTIVLHSRRKKAALYDVNYGMQYVEQVEGEKGIIGHFNNDDAIVFRELNLKGINNIIVRAGGLEKAGLFEFRERSVEGKLLAKVNVKMTGNGEFLNIPVKLKNAKGLIDLCVVAKTKGLLGLNWVEFNE
jgi:cytochrome c